MGEPVLGGELGRLLSVLDARFVSLERNNEQRAVLLEQQIVAGFAAVTHRQDIANGRTLRLEESSARLDTRVATLTKDVEGIEHDLTMATPSRGLSRTQKVAVGGAAGVSGLAVIYAAIELMKAIVGLL